MASFGFSAIETSLLGPVGQLFRGGFLFLPQRIRSDRALFPSDIALMLSQQRINDCSVGEPRTGDDA